MAEYSLVEAARGRGISRHPPLETREPHLITEQFSVFYGEHEAVSGATWPFPGHGDGDHRAERCGKSTFFAP